MMEHSLKSACSSNPIFSRKYSAASLRANSVSIVHRAPPAEKNSMVDKIRVAVDLLGRTWSLVPNRRAIENVIIEML